VLILVPLLSVPEIVPEIRDRVPNGEALNKWIYKNLCDESEFGFAGQAIKGALNDDKVLQKKK